MSHNTSLLGAAASIVLLASVAGTANAAHFNGWYVGLEGGANWVKDNNFSLAGNVCALEGTCTIGDPNVTQLGKANFDTGWAVLATVGYGFGNWRLEAEGGYRRNKFKAVVIDPGDLAEIAGEATAFYKGNLTEYTIMANVLYDVPLMDKLSLSLGVGAGGDNSHLKLGPLKDSQWDFAYQGIVGLNYALSHRLDLFLDFRYLVVPNVGYSASFGPIQIHSDDYQKQTVTLGLRFDLWPDEEPVAVVSEPPPLPPMPAAQSFMIFFGFNKCNITPEADNVLSQAAEAAHSLGSVAIQIVGHTDTKGSGQYNQKLSVCRATAAKSNLVGKGVPAGSIATTGKGETELLVQTADGVKEPQNRRATIDLQ